MAIRLGPLARIRYASARAASHAAVCVAVAAAAAGACSSSETASEPRDAGPQFLDATDAAAHDGAGADSSLHDSGQAHDAGADASLYDGPDKLSETGLYSDIVQQTLAPDVLAYDVRYELWSDGAEKTRYVLLPPGSQIDTSQMNWWKFPVGTKAWKQFTRDGKLVETRWLFKRWQGEGGWLEVAFVWNAAGTEAYAAPDGAKDALGTSHDVPSQADCAQCHDGVDDVLIGVSAIQLSSPSGNGKLSELSAAGKLTHPPAAEYQVPGTGVVQEALGYLHANCGHCHNNVHFLAQKRALRLRLDVESQTPEETPAYETAIWGKMNHVLQGTTIALVPGKPLESQLYVRMSYRDLDSMPPLATELVDDAGLSTIESWILGLSP